jgi:uncharacterized protein YggE
MSRLPKLLSALVLAVFLVPLCHAQATSSPARTVRVSGEATVTAAPDRATVRFGIVSKATTAEAARAQNATAAKSAMNAVRKLGVAEEKMQMEGLRLQPRREYNPKTERREKKGFKATRRVVVELTDLKELPRLVAQVVQRGANRVEGIDYTLSDRSSIRDEALQTAAANAQDKARLLVRALDASLGPVQQITEEDFGYDRPQPRVQAAFAKSVDVDAESEPDAYAAGEIEVTARVQVVFELVEE